MYIAVDLKVIEVQAPAMARALGVGEDLVLSGLIRLWHRCWSLKSEHVTTIELSGFLPHPNGCATLAAFGFIVADGDARWRVTGTDRYTRLSDSRSRAGKARSSSAGRSAGQFTSEKPAKRQHKTSKTPAQDQQDTSPYTEHRTPNTESSKTAAGAAPRETDFFLEDFAAIVGSEYVWGGARDSLAFKALKAKNSLEEIRRRWRAGLALTKWPMVRTVAQLAGKWNDLAEESARQPKPPLSRPDALELGEAMAHATKQFGTYTASQLEGFVWVREGDRLVGESEDVYAVRNAMENYATPLLTYRQRGLFEVER